MWGFVVNKAITISEQTCHAERMLLLPCVCESDLELALQGAVGRAIPKESSLT